MKTFVIIIWIVIFIASLCFFVGLGLIEGDLFVIRLSSVGLILSILTLAGLNEDEV